MVLVPDALDFYQGDVQEEPVGYTVQLFDFLTGEYVTKQFKTEGKAQSAINEQVDKLGEMAIQIDTQNIEKLYSNETQ